MQISSHFDNGSSVVKRVLILFDVRMTRLVKILDVEFCIKWKHEMGKWRNGTEVKVISKI